MDFCTCSLSSITARVEQALPTCFQFILENPILDWISSSRGLLNFHICYSGWDKPSKPIKKPHWPVGRWWWRECTSAIGFVIILKPSMLAAWKVFQHPLSESWFVVKCYACQFVLIILRCGFWVSCPLVMLPQSSKSPKSDLVFTDRFVQSIDF